MSLSTLRISGALIHPGNASFNGLTHLRIENLQFCSTGELQPVLANLSSMPALRVLEIVSVVTSPPFIDTHGFDFDEPMVDSSVSLPNLQTLYLEDMPMDALELVLNSITPRSYRLDLYIDDRNWGDHDPNFNQTALLSMLEGINVTTLMVTLAEHVQINAIRILLACPTIASLYTGRFYISNATLEQLTRPLDDSNPFPALRELHVGRALMAEDVGLEALRKMVSNHPLERLTLGGVLHGFQAPTSGNFIYGRTLHEDVDSVVVSWLRSAVPGFRLINYRDGLPELDYRRRGMWQLW